MVDKIAPETTPEHEPEIPQRYAGRSTGVEIATIAIIRNARTPERHFDVLAAAGLAAVGTALKELGPREKKPREVETKADEEEPR